MYTKNVKNLLTNPLPLDYNYLKIGTGGTHMVLQTIAQTPPFELIHRAIERLDITATKLGIPSLAIYIAVIAWFALMGLAGLHLAKLYTSVGVASVGFYVGSVIFAMLAEKYAVIAIFPHFTGYIIGLILAFALFALGWKFCVPAIYLCIGAAGFYLLYSSFQNLLVGILVGVACMVVVHFCLSFSFLTATSCLAGLGVTALLGAALPQISWLQLGLQSPAILIAIGISALFAAFQWITTKTYGKFGC